MVNIIQFEHQQVILEINCHFGILTFILLTTITLLSKFILYFDELLHKQQIYILRFITY